MDVVKVLQELAKYPLPDEAFASAARALVLTTTLPAQASAAAPLEAPPVENASGASAPQAKTRPPRQDRHVRFTVKDAAGHRTTTCLPRAFRDAAAARLGGTAKLAELVRQLSRQAPLEISNRSGWVQDRIEQKLQASRDTRTPDLFGST